MQIITLRTRIWFWKPRAEARNCLARMGLFLAKLRNNLRGHNHYGWLRLPVFILKVPEHFTAERLTLFRYRPDWIRHCIDPSIPAHSVMRFVYLRLDVCE